MERLPEVRWAVVDHPPEMAKVVKGARVINSFTGVVQMEKYQGPKGGVKRREVRVEEQRIPEWWHLPSTHNPHSAPEAQAAGFSLSVRALHHLMASEVSRLHNSGHRQGHRECWGAERLVLFGMEQGAALALHAALSWPFTHATCTPAKMAYPQAIGGLVALNGWPPFPDSLDSVEAYVASLVPSAPDGTRAVLEKVFRRRLPVLRVFVAANADAEVISPHHSDTLADKLQALGVEVTGGWYPTGSDWLHDPHGVEDVASFLSDLIDRVRWGTVEEAELAEKARVEKEREEERERRFWSEEARVVEMEKQDAREWRAFLKAEKAREKAELDRAMEESLQGQDGGVEQSVEEADGQVGGSRGGARGRGRGRGRGGRGRAGPRGG